MRLKELRQQRGMVCANLAKEIGKNDMLLGTAVHLAKFFEVSLDEFVE